MRWTKGLSSVDVYSSSQPLSLAGQGTSLGRYSLGRSAKRSKHLDVERVGDMMTVRQRDRK